ncbi:MAG TPA: OmpA family protein [Candidatus Bathyarchaeia archaeon]|nr:OmpA family protein [Candidatus Bathyarchaeia archaeon]
MRIRVLMPTVLVAVSGCATEDSVRDLLHRKDVEINQRIEELGNQIKAADQLARGANEQADAAMNRAESVDARLTRLWSNRYRQKIVDTVEIYFAFDKADLSEGARIALLGVVEELQANPTLIVRLRGFSDLTGARDYNYSLVQRRVEAVWRFLEMKGVELSRLQEIRMGPLDRRGIPEDKRRRVTVTLLADAD